MNTLNEKPANIFDIIKRTIFIGLTLLSLGLQEIVYFIENLPQMMGRMFILTIVLISLGLIKSVTLIKSTPQGLGKLITNVVKFIILIIKSIPRMINWIFTIVFITLGLVLSVTFPNIGSIFIAVGIIISPLMSDLLKNVIHTNFSASTKVIVILLGFAITIISLPYETNDTRFLVGFLVETAWLDEGSEEDIKRIKGYIHNNKLRQEKEAFLAVREERMNEIQSLYDNGYYQEIINQGVAYVKFEPKIRQWVEEAKQIQKKEQIEIALEEVPQLMKAHKYQEAYQLAKPLLAEVSELEEHVDKAKKEIDKDVDQLFSWYERGRYSKIVKKASPIMELDCRVRKLVGYAKKSHEKLEKRNRFNKAVKKARKLIKVGKYQEAIKFITKSDYATNAKMQRLVERATIKYTSQMIRKRQYEKAIEFGSKSEYATNDKVKKLINKAKYKLKKIKEKKILARLRNIPQTHIEANIREYTKLVKLFPNDKKYQGKLKSYKQQLLESRKQPPLIITQEEYGDKWPFTVKSGQLECLPPGMVSFKANDEIYAVNDLARARGYKNIDEIWRREQGSLVDLVGIIDKGLDLCTAQ